MKQDIDEIMNDYDRSGMPRELTPSQVKIAEASWWRICPTMLAMAAKEVREAVWSGVKTAARHILEFLFLVFMLLIFPAWMVLVFTDRCCRIISLAKHCKELYRKKDPGKKDATVD